MINIDYYPPFMIDIKKRYTYEPMCNYLCEKWKSIITEKQSIIDSTNEFLKNKHEKQSNNTIGIYNNINNIHNVGYVDISEFANKYNQFVDIYNDCVDSLNGTIYHIMRSPDKFSEYYTENELQKLHADLSEMIDKEKLLKRNKLVLDKTNFELSENLLEILNSTDKLIEEIIIEILDMVELKKYFKFNPFEKIIKEQIGEIQTGGTLSLSNVKTKIDLIVEKLKTLSIKTTNAQFLKNHTEFTSINESIEMLDKLNLQISKTKFKNFDIDLKQLQFPQQLIELFMTDNEQNVSLNFDYTDFDSNKTKILQQKIDFLRTTNAKIKLKISHRVSNEDDISYLPEDIKYEDNSGKNVLKNEYDNISKDVAILNTKHVAIKKLTDNTTILQNAISSYNKINVKYFDNKNEPTITNFLFFVESDQKNIAYEKIHDNINNLKKLLEQNNKSIFSELDRHKRNFFNGEDAHIKIMYNDIKVVINNHIKYNTSQQTIIQEITKKVFEYALLKNHHTFDKLPEKPSIEPNAILKYLTNFGIVSILNDYNNNTNLKTKTKIAIDKHQKLYRIFDAEIFNKKLNPFYEKIKNQIDTNVNINVIINNIIATLKEYNLNDDQIHFFMNCGIIGIVQYYLEKEQIIISENKKAQETFDADVKELDTLCDNFYESYKVLKKQNYYDYLLKKYHSYNLSELLPILRTQLVKITEKLKIKSNRLNELENQIGLSKNIDQQYFKDKIKTFGEKINKISENIYKKIMSLNKNLPTEEQIKIIDTTVDMWYKNTQIGGNITSDKNIILNKIQHFSLAQLNMLEKIKELSEEMRVFRLGMTDYLNAVVSGVKQNLNMLYSMSYILNVFNDIHTLKYKIKRFIDYDQFQEIYTKINNNSIRELQPIVTRMKKICNFINVNFKEKQHLSIVIDETNKLFIDLIVLVHFSNSFE